MKWSLLLKKFRSKNNIKLPIYFSNDEAVCLLCIFTRMYVSIKWWLVMFCKAVINLSDRITWPWCSIALQKYKRNGNWLWEKAVKLWRTNRHKKCKWYTYDVRTYYAHGHTPSPSQSQVTTKRDHNEMAMHIICTFTLISSWKVRSYPKCNVVIVIYDYCNSCFLLYTYNLCLRSFANITSAHLSP